MDIRNRNWYDNVSSLKKQGLGDQIHDAAYLISTTMQIAFQKPISYDVPVGRYAAELYSVTDIFGKLDGCAQEIRMTWKILDIIDPRFEHRVGKNYCADIDNSTPLRGDMMSWLSDDFAVLTQNGSLDTETLIGRKGEVSVSHTVNRSHKKPFVNLQAVHPPASLN